MKRRDIDDVIEPAPSGERRGFQIGKTATRLVEDPSRARALRGTRRRVLLAVWSVIMGTAETVMLPEQIWPSALLEKTKCHLYFVSDERKQRIDVLHVWDGRRERLPAL